MDALRLLSRSSGLRLNQTQQGTHRIPSAGDIVTDQVDAKSNSKKRKHDEVEEQDDSKLLTETEIRQLQKQHKIRITDLRALHDEEISETRKVQKESSRLFPQPLQSFSQLRKLDVNHALIANIAEQAYKDATEVQLATIPLLLRSGKDEPDLLTIAPTGSGKTLAFLIPLINKIGKTATARKNGEQHVSALILAPTKELVSQIVNEGRKLTVSTGVRIAELRKGMKLHAEEETADLNSSEDESDHEPNTTSIIVKTDILVSTPLSLLNTITSTTSGSPLPLPQIRSFILDEADVLLDPLFRDQVLSIWSSCTSPELRTSLWSATIGSSIEELAISIINNHPSRLRRKTQPALLRTIIGLKDTSLPSINHRLIYASTEPGKLMGLRQLIHPSSTSSSNSKSAAPQILRPPFLIFTQTIPRAQSLYNELQYDIPPSAGGPSRIAVLHSSLTNKERTTTMTSFRQGKIWILITTDLLSRGIDFRGINGIVNYDIPTTAASYVHRAGRTGRAGRQGGIAVTFYTKDDVKYLKPIANIISASEQKSTSTSAPSSLPSTSSLPAWLIPSLPHLTKSSKKDLKTRGVDVRRSVKESDNDVERKRKLKNRIGTTSGYERKLEDRRKGMKEGSRRRKAKEEDGGGEGEGDEGEWGGLDD